MRPVNIKRMQSLVKCARCVLRQGPLPRAGPVSSPTPQSYPETGPAASMNFFGKSRNLPQQPPQLPQMRIGAAFERVLDTEEEDNSDDMYEPAPSNTQHWRRSPPPRPFAGNNVYAGRSPSSPGRAAYLPSNRPVNLPGMHSTACRRESHPGYSNGSRISEVFGKQATPTDRRFSLPCPVEQTPPRRPPQLVSSCDSNGVYLLPIDEQDDHTEGIYLQCEASPCDSAPALGYPGLNLKGVSPFPNPKAPAAALPRTRPLKSTPVPLPRMPTPTSGMPTASAIKQAANKLKTTQQGFRPLPDMIAESNRSPVSNRRPSGATEDLGLSIKPWYGGHCDRNKAETLLQQTRKDGAFMVRKSSGQNFSQPYTLVVFYKGRTYNIPIRCTEGGRQYTLGKEGKNHEELFPSLTGMIQHYQDVPLVLIGSSSSSKEQTCLHCPVRP